MERSAGTRGRGGGIGAASLRLWNIGKVKRRAEGNWPAENTHTICFLVYEFQCGSLWKKTEGSSLQKQTWTVYFLGSGLFVFLRNLVSVM